MLSNYDDHGAAEDALVKRAEKAEARVRDLEAALVYSAFAQHKTARLELPEKIRLIDGNQVCVKVGDAWVCARAAGTETPAAPIACG